MTSAAEKVTKYEMGVLLFPINAFMPCHGQKIMKRIARITMQMNDADIITGEKKGDIDLSESSVK